MIVKCDVDVKNCFLQKKSIKLLLRSRSHIRFLTRKTAYQVLIQIDLMPTGFQKLVQSLHSSAP